VATSLVTNVVRGRQEPDRLLLLIHGKGADEHDLEPLIPYLDPEGRFLTVLPRAPLSFMGGWQWYETDGIPKAGPQLIAGLDALDDLLDSSCAEYGFDRSQSIVAGFSQGQLYGKGLAAGVAIVVLGVMLDRLTQAAAKRWTN